MTPVQLPEVPAQKWLATMPRGVECFGYYTAAQLREYATEYGRVIAAWLRQQRNETPMTGEEAANALLALIDPSETNSER